MKKSVEILGLPIISITEGRELGMSKTLLIDAQNGQVAAITIEDEDWYRGVKLIPYESVIAIGEDAVTITHSENILNLDEAGDYENLLIENIRVIGTKAITKSGRIQGKVTELIIGENGRIEKCEITAPDGSINEVSADQIAIFGKQVTVVDIDTEKKNEFVKKKPAHKPVKEAIIPPVEEIFEIPAENFETSTETQAELEKIMTPEPVVEILEEKIKPVVEEKPAVEAQPVVEEKPAVEAQPVEEKPAVEAQPVEEKPAVEVQPVEEKPAVEVQPVEEKPTVEVQPVEEKPAVEVQPVEEKPAVEDKPVVEKKHAVKAKAPVIVEAPVIIQAPVEESATVEDQRIAAMTRQAEDLKAALKKAKASKQSTDAASQSSQKKQAEKAVDERRRRVLLGKHATKTISTESGKVVVEAGAEVTEEVLQRARLSNKFIELSMNVQ